MKQIAIADVALVLGVVLGGLGPLGEVRSLEDRVATLEAPDRGDCRSTVGADLVALMNAGVGSRDAAELERQPPEDSDADVLDANPEAAALVGETNGGEAVAPEEDGVSEEGLELA